MIDSLLEKVVQEPWVDFTWHWLMYVVGVNVNYEPLKVDKRERNKG